MSHNLSQIKALLSRNESRALHRQMFILSGDISWQKNILKEILSGFEKDSLWVGEETDEHYPCIDTKKSRSWLGKEKRVVIFDANKNFDADSFAAISGIVVGGGLLFLLLPVEEKWHDVYSSHFGQRLIQSIRQSEFTIIKQKDENFVFNSSELNNKLSDECDFPFLTMDQKNTVEAIEKEVCKETQTPLVLISDRGRGKSAALGISAARLLESGNKNIVITAPRLRATDIIFKHIAILLPEAEISRGCVKYKNGIIQFYSPDQLIQNNVVADLLLVDEAAAIPVPLLTSFLYKYPQCVFSTTVHGYEGTGRGFTLRFFKELDEFNSHWLKLYMQSPIRWAENDPLEKWMFNLLCLDAEIVDSDLIKDIDSAQVEFSYVKHSDISKNVQLLNECFSLLVLAHYRTQPSDLQRMLDDESLSLYVGKYNEHVIAVALVSHEGGFSESLATQVYRGERRPPGHLLAQALTYHCGVEQAATLNYARIMRVAIHPELQRKGFGTKLVKFIIANEKRKGCDGIGSSFGLNAGLLNFWKEVGFSVMRIGFKREQTSGEHAAIIMKPLSQMGEEIHHEASMRFTEQLPYWFDDILSDLPDDLKQSFEFKKNNHELQLSESDKKDIQSFILYSRNYELCIAAITKLILINYDVIRTARFPKDLSEIIENKVINKKDWKQISSVMRLVGKGHARKLFKKAIIELINNFDEINFKSEQ